MATRGTSNIMENSMTNYRLTSLRRLISTVATFATVVLLVLVTPTVEAVDFTWTGGGATDVWDDPANWNMIGIPDGNNDTATISPSLVPKNPLLVANRTLGDVTINSGTVELNTFRLLVQAGPHTGTVTLGANMIVRSGAATFELDTDNLVVNSSGDLFIETLAVAQVDFNATINSGGIIQMRGANWKSTAS